MEEITIAITFGTDNPDQTVKSIKKYLEDTLNEYFIQDNEEIVDIKIIKRSA